MNQQEYRRLRRDHVLRNHPDRGGDAETFIAGLLALEQEWSRAAERRVVVAVRTTPWHRRLWRGAVVVLTRRSEPPRVH